MVSTWNIHQRVVNTVFHSSAIFCTLFRLSYRWYTRRFWWEDAWAIVALVFDVACLVCAWVQAQVRVSVKQDVPLIDSASSWVESLAFTCVLWAARLSLTFSVIRVADHRPKFQRFALGVAGLFGLMWIGLLGQKIYICYLQGCVVKSPLAISQLTTDVVSDTILVIMPFLLLRGVRISSNRYTLICCAFFASISITVITIFHSILLFRPVTAWTGTVAHVKTAVSLIVCNLLVIVTFAYRVCCKLGGVDLDHSFVGSEPIIFTSIDLNELTIGTNGEGGEGSPEVPPFQHEADDMVADKLVATTVSDVESSGGRGEAFDVGSGSIS